MAHGVRTWARRSGASLPSWVAGTATTATIAAEVGYSSASTFSTAFTRSYGASPTAHRRATHVRHPRNPPGSRGSTSP